MTKPNRTANQFEDKLPPNSIEAERGVLGCCLLDSNGEAVAQCVEAIPASTVFYHPQNRSIWECVVRLHAERKPVDLITLVQALRESGELDAVGGYAGISGLTDGVPSAANVGHYLETVVDQFRLREFLRACGEAQSIVLHPEEGEEGTGPSDVSTRLAVAEARILEVTDQRIPSVARPVREILGAVITRVEENSKPGRKMKIGPRSPWNYLNNIVPGFGPGQMVVIAGRPGSGKSGILMQLAEHIACVERVPSVVFSLEMTAESMMERQLFQSAAANLQHYRNGTWDQQSDIPKLSAAVPKLARGEWWIEDCHRMSVEEFEVKVRRMVRRKKVGAVFLDYLQLLNLRGRRYGMKPVDEMAEISKRVKGLALELEIPIIVAAQMNRNIEVDDRKRTPQLSDLRECGQIEQDADVVMMLWNPPIKSPEDETSPDMKWLPKMRDLVPSEWLSCSLDEGGIAWKKHLVRVNMYIAKQREGRSSVDGQMVFVRDWCRFVDPFRHREDRLQVEMAMGDAPVVAGTKEASHE
jgi:replicative DNA helicase